jgi:putative transposase
VLGRQSPKVQAMLEGAKDELLAFTAFPPGHWKKIWSTNPLERLNKEIKRRCDVVGVFPNPAALLRLSGAVLLEQHDEWLVSDRRYLGRGLDGGPDRHPRQEPGTTQHRPADGMMRTH